MYASEPDTHCRTIFSVNSLGQQSHWQWREARRAPGHTLQGHSSLLRPHVSKTAVETNMAKNLQLQMSHISLITSKVLESIPLKIIVSLTQKSHWQRILKAIPFAKMLFLDICTHF